MEVYELDFTHVVGNEQVRSQGVTTCIKTKSKGYFSLDLDRFPTRQDLAKKKLLGDFFIKKRLSSAENEKAKGRQLNMFPGAIKYES